MPFFKASMSLAELNFSLEGLQKIHYDYLISNSCPIETSSRTPSNSQLPHGLPISRLPSPLRLPNSAAWAPRARGPLSAAISLSGIYPSPGASHAPPSLFYPVSSILCRIGPPPAALSLPPSPLCRPGARLVPQRIATPLPSRARFDKCAGARRLAPQLAAAGRRSKWLAARRRPARARPCSQLRRRAMERLRQMGRARRQRRRRGGDGNTESGENSAAATRRRRR